MTQLSFYRAALDDTRATETIAANSWLEAAHIAAQRLKALHDELSPRNKPRHCRVRFKGEPDAVVSLDAVGRISVEVPARSPGIAAKWLKKIAERKAPVT